MSVAEHTRDVQSAPTQDEQIRCISQLLSGCPLLEQISVVVSDYRMDDWAKQLVAEVRLGQLKQRLTQSLRCLEVVCRQPVSLWSLRCVAGLAA